MNYGQLKAAIANRLGRTNLTAIIPDFITFAEPRFYQGFRDPEFPVDPIRVRAMLATETASLAALPTDFLSVDRLTIPDTYAPRTLIFKVADEFNELPNTNYPQYYTLKDGLIKIEGGTPASFSLSYYKKFTALVADADTNWLLTNCPNAYLYSALIEAYAHIKDDARIIQAGRMYAAAVNGLIMTDKEERHSGSVLDMGSAR